jgi:ABC-type branched-subunit amino acid transport system substrate-binding protein
MSKNMVGVLAVSLVLALVADACSDDKSGGGNNDDGRGIKATQAIDYDALGLWDDGPCDESRDPLVIGLMTVFESPVLSLKDEATALEVSAKAFNARGGANGACIEVHTCDDGGNVDQAVACVREIDGAGVVVTVNDLGTAGHLDVRNAMTDAGIPRIASNVVPEDWDDPNTYPLDASATGFTLLLPQALIEEDVTEIGVIRVDLAAASALLGLMSDVYEGKATFPVDIPVPAGTTDYSQFILAAQDAGAGGVSLALGEQESTQVVRAGQQLNTDMLMGASLGAFSQSAVAELGGFGDHMVFLWSYPPATSDVPVYAALRDDLATSGEESLQPANLTANPMRSWIGLYALLKMIRDAHMTTFSRAGITAMLNEATDVPMLGMFGGENWTPALNHPGIFKRAGINHWATWRWNADAKGPEGLEGDFVQRAEISFDEVMCGTPFGAPKPC